MYELHFKMYGLPKSLNKALRTNRYQRNDDYKFWYDAICEMLADKRPDFPLKRAKIKIVRYFYRELDFDGLVGSFKPIVDSLIHAGIIIDDNWKCLGSWDVDQKYCSKKEQSSGFFELTVSELPI